MVLVTFAGCLGEPTASLDDAWEVAPLAFTRSDARWLAYADGGCGACAGMGSFGTPAEHHAFFVLVDRTLVLVDYNVDTHGAGYEAHPDVRFDGATLEHWLRDTPRGDAGGLFVVRVTTGNLVGDDVRGELFRRWSEEPVATDCDDYGAGYGLAPSEYDAREREIVCPTSEENTFHAFTSLMHDWRAALRDVGVAQGAPTEGR